MAEQAVRDVISAFQTGMQEIERRRQYSLEQQRLEQERQARQDQLQLERERLTESARQFDAQNKLSQQAHNLQAYTTAQALAEKAGAGQSIVGAQIQPAGAVNLGTLPSSSIPGAGTVIPTAGQDQITFPFTDATGKPISVTQQTPEMQALRQAGLLRIMKQPEEEYEMKKIGAQSQAAITKDVFMENLRQINRVINAAEAQKGRETLERMRIQGQKDVATIRSAGSQKAQAQAVLNNPGLPDTLNQGLTGTQSLEDMIKGRSMAEKNLIIDEAMRQNFRFLPQTEINKIDYAMGMGSLLDDVLNMINMRDKYSRIGLPGGLGEYTKPGQDFQALRDIVQSKVPQFSVNMTGVRRFSNPELKRFDEYFVPREDIGKFNKDAAMEKYYSLQHDIMLIQKQVLQGLSPKQKQAVDARFREAMLPNPLYLGTPMERGGQGPASGLNYFQLDPKTNQIVPMQNPPEQGR